MKKQQEAKNSGKIGEDFAASYYQSLGYTVLERNYHSRYGEIDIIAQNDARLVFVEVKLRRSNAAAPAQAVDENKIRRLALTAAKYMQGCQNERPVQFDVFELYCADRIYKFKRIENAFTLDDAGDDLEAF